jgi:hypothetical protein
MFLAIASSIAFVFSYAPADVVHLVLLRDHPHRDSFGLIQLVAVAYASLIGAVVVAARCLLSAQPSGRGQSDVSQETPRK